MFRAPLVPFLPAFSICLNWYLIAQNDWVSLLYGFAWILAAVAVYFAYGFWHSVGQHTQWQSVLRGSIGFDGIPSLNEIRPSASWVYGEGKPPQSALLSENLMS